jgi:hypothetical protein
MTLKTPDSGLKTQDSGLRTKAVQKFLPIKVELRLPTVDLAGARALTGLHENTIKELVDSEDLIAWNIARSTGDRRELRILGLSARAWPSPFAWDEDRVILALYGPVRPFILGTRFHRAWNCDSGHMINLVQDKILQTVKGTDYGPGRGLTPCITWASAINFLKTRRLS